MRKNLFLIAIVAITFASCKKESASPNPGGQGQGNGTGTGTVSKIKTWSNSASQNTYKYNNEGKLTEISSNTGSKNTYEYVASKIIQKQFNNAGINDFTAEYELDAAGMGVTEKRPNQPGFTGTFIYTSDKLSVKKIFNNNGSIQTKDYFYSNGNCDSIRFLTNNVLDYTLHTTFYTDKLNYLSNEAYGYPFFGKESKNLRKTEQFVYPDGTKELLVSISYEFDSNGRPVKETKTQGANIFINYITYY